MQHAMPSLAITLVLSTLMSRLYQNIIVQYIKKIILLSFKHTNECIALTVTPMQFAVPLNDIRL